jgi:hypothetical protein
MVMRLLLQTAVAHVSTDVTQALVMRALDVRAQLLQAGEGLAACACCIACGAAPPRHVLQLTVQWRPPQTGHRVPVVHLLQVFKSLKSQFSELHIRAPGGFGLWKVKAQHGSRVRECITSTPRAHLGCCHRDRCSSVYSAKLGMPWGRQRPIATWDQ